MSKVVQHFSHYNDYLRATVEEIRRAIDAGKWDHFESEAWIANVDFLRWYLDTRQQYRTYKYAGERVVSPFVFRAQRGGDCDNWTVYLASMAARLGRDVVLNLEYRIVGGEKRYYHIYPTISGMDYDPFKTEPKRTFLTDSMRLS